MWWVGCFVMGGCQCCCIFTLVHVNMEDEIIFGIGQDEKSTIFFRFNICCISLQDSNGYLLLLTPHQKHHVTQEKYHFSL